eukprot:Rmarinus@m.21746
MYCCHFFIILFCNIIYFIIVDGIKVVGCIVYDMVFFFSYSLELSLFFFGVMSCTIIRIMTSNGLLSLSLLALLSLSLSLSLHPSSLFPPTFSLLPHTNTHTLSPHTFSPHSLLSLSFLPHTYSSLQSLVYYITYSVR